MVKLRVRWESTGLFKRIDQCKKVFEEPRGSGGSAELDKLLKAYRAAVVTGMANVAKQNNLTRNVVELERPKTHQYVIDESKMSIFASKVKNSIDS